jgi:putative SOS response-associated peptidase YedK
VAILTAAANAGVAPVHDRMPAILDPDDLDAWLDCERVPLKEVIGLLRPAPDGLLEAVLVNRRPASPRRGAAESGQPLQGRLL